MFGILRVFLPDSAFAGAVVHDPTSCVDPAQLDLELARMLPSDLLDVAELDITIRETEAGLVVYMTAQSGVATWSRSLDIFRQDCPNLSETLAVVAARGLAALPKPVPEPDPNPLPYLVGFSMGGSMGLGALTPMGVGRVWASFGRSWIRPLLSIRGDIGGFEPLGAGRARLSSGMAGGGVSFPVSAGPWAVKPGIEVLAGFSLAQGADFDRSFDHVRPRVSIVTGLDMWTPLPFLFSFQIEYVAVRTRLVTQDRLDVLDRPPFRAILSVGFGSFSRQK